MSKGAHMSITRFKTAYGPNLAAPGLSFEGCVSMTSQADARSCDINSIMDQFAKTGYLPQGAGAPVFGEWNDGNHFQSQLNAVIEAQDAFMELPAQVRSRFSNDPAQLLNFLNDDSNRDEAIKLGLIDKPPVKNINGIEPQLDHNLNKFDPLKKSPAFPDNTEITK